MHHYVVLRMAMVILLLWEQADAYSHVTVYKYKIAIPQTGYNIL